MGLSNILKQYKIIFLFPVIFLFACSSSNLKIDSTPDGAEVFVLTKDQPRRKLGQTPLNINEVFSEAQSGAYQLQISKEGYHSENILIGSTLLPKYTEVTLALKEVNPGSRAMNEQIIQSVASGVAQAQHQIRSKEYDSAERTLMNMLTQYPSVATFHALMGNLFYLRRDLSKALTFYRKANSLNPGNPETTRMINKIRDVQGSGASSDGGVF